MELESWARLAPYTPAYTEDDILNISLLIVTCTIEQKEEKKKGNFVEQK